MKNYNELANELFERRDEYNTVKTQKMIKFKKTVSTLSCVCLVALLGIGVWQSGVVTETNNEQNTSGEESVTSVSHIPAIELPKGDSNIIADMIGLVVYQGKIYTQTEFLQCDAETIHALVGDYLGTANATIHEYFTQDGYLENDYTKEFASTISGDVHTVNGYNKDFRICIWGINEDNSYYIEFLECLNDIDISTGNELYGSERLNLKNNYVNVMFQNHADWDIVANDFQAFKNIAQDDWNSIIDILCKSPFISDIDYDSITALNQIHVYFSVNDGTTVQLRFFENGYVSYQDCFVKIDDETIQKIFNR